MMTRFVVCYQLQDGVHNDVGPTEKARSATGEALLIDVKAGEWRFEDKKLEGFGSFQFGRGPTFERKESLQMYPKTQTVINKNDNAQIAEAIRFIRHEAFSDGYRASGAIDAN